MGKRKEEKKKKRNNYNGFYIHGICPHITKTHPIQISRSNYIGYIYLPTIHVYVPQRGTMNKAS